MKALYWCGFTLIILTLFSADFLVAAEPSIIDTSGTVLNRNIITVNGANFGTKVTGDFSDYFDDYISPWTCNTSSGCSRPGPWSSQYIAPSEVERRSESGFTKNLLEINLENGNYSTGYGFRKMQGYNNYKYGMWNQQLRKNLSADNKEFWLRFYMKWGDVADPWPTPTSNWKQSKQIWFRLGDGADNGQVYLCALYYTSRIGAALYKFGNQELGGNGYSVPDRSQVKYPGNDKWMEVRIHFKMEIPDQNSNNGGIAYYFNGTRVLYNTSVNFTSESESTEFYQIGIGGNITTTDDGGATYFFDDNPKQSCYVYYDDITIVEGDTDPGSIATVYLSNNATWGAGVSDRWNGDSNFIRQKVGGSAAADYGFKSWSNTQCKFEVNLGTIDTNEPVYLYVTNWNGETNSSGFYLVAGFEPAKMKGYKFDKIQ